MDKLWKMAKSRTLWGLVAVLVSPELADAGHNLVEAVDAGVAQNVITAAGAAVVVVGRLWARGPIMTARA